MELSAFTPFFRLGEGPPGASDAPSGFDPETLALLARMSEIYATLKPYHLATVSEYSREGLPPMRHPWIHYGSDPQTYTLVYQYLYGRDLMVAPALGPSQGFTELYLPEGGWVHLWTSRSFRSGRVAVESPSGCPAVFYRAESGFARLFDALRRGVRRV
jgi:alpha-glucosidase